MTKSSEGNVMTVETNQQSTWWGLFKLEIEQNKEWHIGPLKLIIRRLINEWQIAHESNENFDSTDFSWEINDTDQQPESFKNNSRYILNDSSGQLIITPKLADRTIVTRPNIPFNLAAGEEITLYVSSPLWIELDAGSTIVKPLTSIAIQRLSDTWFGPSTLEGDFCYAATTHCRLNLEDLPEHSHRAITPVLIRNRSDSTLLLERLNLPIPFLPLYTSPTNQLWTPQITLTREKDGDMAELKIEEKPPTEIGAMEKVSDARNKENNNVLFRAFNTVFS